MAGGDWFEPDEADIEKYVNRIARLYSGKVRDIQDVLRDVDIETLTAADERAVLKQVSEILTELNESVVAEAGLAVDEVYEHGRARALVALGVSSSLGGAKRFLRSADVPVSQLHRAFIRREKEALFSDLLAATTNTSRRVTMAVREVSAERIRDGIRNRTGRRTINSGIRRDLKRRLGESAGMSIRDSAGRRWRTGTYVDMVTRTKLAEAQVEAARNEAIERGALYGVVSRHGDSCPKCRPWQGRILRLSADADGDWPTVEDAKAAGLLHPNCKHVITPARTFSLLPEDIRKLNEI